MQTVINQLSLKFYSIVLCCCGAIVQRVASGLVGCAAYCPAQLTVLTRWDASKLNKLSKQRLQRRVQKLASAAQIFFAKQGLLQNHNQLLAKINSEAKVRRATLLVILGKGKAKVISYKNLKEARATRAAKDKAIAERGKAKRGRKREVAEQELCVLELVT